MSTQEEYLPPSMRPRARRRSGRKANPERAVAIATRVSFADRDRLDYLAHLQGTTTSDLLRAALEPLLADAREFEEEKPAT